MYFKKYIDEITQLIKINIERLTPESWPKNIHYSISSENLFKLTFEEYQRLFEIVEEISLDLNLEDKFPKKFIFDKLVTEVIIKSYDYSSTTSEIKSNLKERFREFEDILNEELNEWTYFIPISGIVVEDVIDFGKMSVYPFKSFKQEFLDYLINVKKMPVADDEFKILFDELHELKSFCFVKLTVNGTKETSRDKALSKVNEILSIFSLYKPHNYNGFGIMGEVLPLNSGMITYSKNLNNFNISHKSTVRGYSFNLSESFEHMKKYYLDYFVCLLNKKELCYVEKYLLNSIQWYYESTQTEIDFDEDVTEATLNSDEYFNHYSYFKLGSKLINLITSLESLLTFKKHTDMDLRKERFDFVMNYNNVQHYDYSNDLDELYDLRNDIAHGNKFESLLKFNIKKNTNLLNIFIIKFVEIKLDFDADSKKSLKTKEDLVEFYDGRNRLGN